MTYNVFVDKLRKFQAVRIHWNYHEIDVLLNSGFIWVESIPSVPLQVFHNLPEALCQWRYPEARSTLGEIITEIDDKGIDSNPSFREIAFLDPNLLVGPTNLQRNSITGGMSFPDSSFEHHIQSKEESISACLYNLTLDAKIYQTLEWRWLKTMLEENRILLKTPSSYHDAWESFMFRKYDWEEQGDECRVQLTGFEKCFYCSCWSACEESDGIWSNRVRGSSLRKGRSKHKKLVDSQMVKVETTVGDLLVSLGLGKLLEGRNIWKNFRAGKVSYCDEFELRMFKERSLNLLETRTNFYLPCFQSLFMKRKQFEYEQEVRLVLFDNAEWKSLQRKSRPAGVFLQTEPQTWIHEVVVHPDCKEKYYKSIRKQLSAFGIDRVVMSPLSQKPCEKRY